jgi:hypothetical protein
LIYFIFTGENYDRTQESPVRKDLPQNQTVEKSGGQEAGSPTNSFLYVIILRKYDKKIKDISILLHVYITFS